ncbi:carboxymuconolactone decarboxylase [endosymbiont 'TC1' of Trimyema compressum]|uniref:carboxymuconolactone decarboxylase family protein n=1 Tax=endosymbiont 'TC1' of Trimyema compressum TaxID=243899 RepID=UPI0007F116B6|nr:carboxymuconolactone decarboxylase family protein [endosymbiont 'TC1' of Trimyema compressum]AMP20454.1 carboxymuconolactone decarboxylase [endosymbiont 'TC1' of Trimyema compressum]
MNNVSDNFKFFMEESGDAGEAFMEAVMRISNASALDKKTGKLAYIAVLAATGILGGLPFHVKSAKLLGASRAEIKSALLVGMPVTGLKVTEALLIGLNSYDEEE